MGNEALCCIHDYKERVDPDSNSEPSGECPFCGALCYPIIIDEDLVESGEEAPTNEYSIPDYIVRDILDVVNSPRTPLEILYEWSSYCDLTLWTMLAGFEDGVIHTQTWYRTREDAVKAGVEYIKDKLEALHVIGRLSEYSKGLEKEGYVELYKVTSIGGPEVTFSVRVESESACGLLNALSDGELEDQN